MKPTKPWPMHLVGLLLFFEIAGAILLSLYSLYLDIGGEAWTVEIVLDAFAHLFLSMSVMALITIVGLITLISIIRWHATAWQNAMAVQGLALTLGLAQYFNNQSVYSYPIMVVGIGLVIYLMLPTVQGAFLPRILSDEEEIV